ncbi:MAG: hypothetical protein PHQ35_05765 [Phycisphaerae bacterium]|nr:hypothetical protein [Phycisphaerae bacterium]MDD5381313.1 hypothetical protein [Phycisphaerae bacterium]
MNPGTLQTTCQIVFAIGIVVTGLAGFGSYYYGKKDAAVIQQTTISKLDQLLESTNNENRTKLLEKYPAGYVSFGVDSSETFSSTVFPYGKEVLAEYEFDWSKVKIEKLTSSSLTILLPTIRYKPLNGLCEGITMTINRRPCGKEYTFPVKPAGTHHRIYIELLKDDDHQLIFVIGFRKIAT